MRVVARLQSLSKNGLEDFTFIHVPDQRFWFSVILGYREDITRSHEGDDKRWIGFTLDIINSVINTLNILGDNWQHN